MLLALALTAEAAKDETILVSRQSAGEGGAGGDAVSFRASVSADGRFVAFESTADNLSAEDNDGVFNIFLRDTRTNVTTLVSRQSAGDGGSAADASASKPSASADGRFVAFESGANNLSAEDNNAVSNVFLRDTQTNTTTLVSRQSAGDGGVGADAGAAEPEVSADGRFVAFESGANNLSAEDNNAVTNVFLRDTQTNTTTLVSRQSAGDGGVGADDQSVRASVSADGRFVAFESGANNLSAEDSDAFFNIFVRDLQTSTTTLVSRQSSADGGAGADASSFRAAISADGRRVAFESGANNLSAEDSDAFFNIFVRDLQTSTTTLVSRRSVTEGGAGADENSFAPSLSADGRFVAFESLADNLSAEDSNAVTNVFVRDVQTSATTLVSRQSAAAGGAGADDQSSAASISGEGRFVAFTSLANNLSAEDNDAVSNVFLRDVLGPPPPTPGPGPGPAPTPGPEPGPRPPAIPPRNPPAGSSADVFPPDVQLRLRRQELGVALRRGYSGYFTTGEPGVALLELLVEGKHARRLAGASRRVAVAHGSKALTGPGRATVVAKFTSRAKRAFRRAPRLTLLVRVAVTDAAGNRTSRRARIALNRSVPAFTAGAPADAG